MKIVSIGRQRVHGAAKNGKHYKGKKKVWILYYIGDDQYFHSKQISAWQVPFYMLKVRKIRVRKT